MSETRLTELLTDLVADVASPLMTQQAWRAGRRSRRNRIVAGVAVSGVLLLGAAAAVADGRLMVPSHAGRGATPTATPSPTSPVFLPVPGEPRIENGPERSAVPALPLLPTRFSALSSAPFAAEALSAKPVTRIVAAVQQAGWPVLVLGQDDTWREVDGAAMAGLFSTSISPDARQLALTLNNVVLLIDAVNGHRNVLSVPASIDRIDNLLWLPDGQHLGVSGDGGAGILSTEDGSYQPTAITVHELAVSRPGDPVLQLTASALILGSGDTRVDRAYGLGAHAALSQWYGDGWVDGWLAARTGFLSDSRQVAAVIDIENGRVTDLLNFSYGPPGEPATRSQGCCATLGWLDEQTVLLRDGGQLLAWRFATGSVFRVAQLPGATTEGPDPGYDTSVALAQV